MNFLEQERATLEKFIPTLDAKLEAIPLLTMESRGNPALQLFRELGGPGLLVPTKYGGSGVSALEIARIQRALASRSPSLAIAANMHNCTVSAIPACEATAELFESIAQHNLYLASGFAEGQIAQSILSPNMKVERNSHGLIVSGSKKPCSLSESMDFLTASVLVPSPEGEGHELALVIIPANSPGIERRPFWSNWVLAGAESNEVVLNQVEVPEEFVSYFDQSEESNSEIAKAFLWFELLISASYIGVVSALVERVLRDGKGLPSERMLLAVEVEGAMTALEGVAYSIMLSEITDAVVAKALFVRYAVQRAIERASVHAAELLGGMSFVSSSEIAYLLAASRAIAFHPPSRISIAPALDRYLVGGSLVIP